MGIYTDARGGANINAVRKVVDMSQSIAMLEPAKTPVTAILKRVANTKKKAINYKFDWLEDEYIGRWVQADGGETDAATALTVHSGEGALIKVGDLLKVVSTKEVLKVTSIATDEITVTRAFGTTSAAVIPDDAYIMVFSNANMQGADAPAEKYVAVTDVTNYTQIFRTVFSVTGTLNQMKLYGGNELARLQKKKGVEHMRDIEFAMLFGEKKLDVSGDQPLTTTAGINYFLDGTTNATSIDADGATAEADFNTWLQGLFSFGSEEKLLVASPYTITWINEFAQSKVQLIQADMDKTYGINVMRYMTPHGVLNMVHHPLLTSGYQYYSYAIDLEYVKYRYIEGRDTKLKTNIQNNDADGRKDEYLTEAGLEFKLPEAHGRLILT